MKRQANSNGGTITLNHNLSQKCAKEITEAPAYAVALDLLPMCFAENNHADMSKLLTSVFKAGRSVPLYV